MLCRERNDYTLFYDLHYEDSVDKLIKERIKKKNISPRNFYQTNVNVKRRHPKKMQMHNQPFKSLSFQKVTDLFLIDLNLKQQQQKQQ